MINKAGTKHESLPDFPGLKPRLNLLARNPALALGSIPTTGLSEEGKRYSSYLDIVPLFLKCRSGSYSHVGAPSIYEVCGRASRRFHWAIQLDVGDPVASVSPSFTNHQIPET